MTKHLRSGMLVAGVGLALIIAACGGETHAVPTRQPISPANVVATATVRAGGTAGGAAGPVDTSPGGQLFSQNCVACHTVKGQGGTIGPNLTNIGTVAATRKPGLDAAAYIKESIMTPNAFVAPGFQPGIMPQTFAQSLTPDQIDTLVKYLSDQK